MVGQQQAESTVPLLNLEVMTFQEAKEGQGEAEKTERLDVLAGLRKYASEHVLLIGRPGSGKSTALARLLLEEATAKNQIPVLVELRYYKISILELIRDFLKRYRLLLKIDEIETLLFEGQLLLLVDGVNELPSEEARRDLQVFRQDNPETPMIFTTRDLGVGGDLGIAKKLEMQPLTPEQMRQFVKAYLPQQGEQMLQQLGSRLQEFGQTPLLLWMLCSLFSKIREVPQNLGLVFRVFTQTYEKQLRQNVSLRDMDLRQSWSLALEGLAFRMFTQGSDKTELRVAIPKQEAQEILKEFLHQDWPNKPPALCYSLLQDLLNHHLIQPGTGDQIEFRHQLIQEYYAAESLLKLLPNLSDDTLQREYLNYLKWTEPLALMLELVEEEVQAVRVVRLALEVDWQLGARLAGAVKPEFQKQTIDLVNAIEASQQVKIKLLSLTRSHATIPPLIKALEDADSFVRGRVADVLGESKSEAAIPPLIKALEDANSYVRGRAADALGESKSEAAIPPLIKALEHTNSYVRMSAADALGKINSEAAIPHLIKALEHTNSYVRMSAADALVKITTPKFLPDFHHLLKITQYTDIFSTIAAIQERYKFYNYTSDIPSAKFSSNADSTNNNTMNPELFLEQKNVVPLLDVLNRWAQQVNIASDRQDVLRNADLHETFFSKLIFNSNSQAFANALVAEFKKYSFSARRADYHPLVNLLQYLKTDDLSDQDFALFNRLIEQGQENLKALVARHAVGRIESPKGTGIGTGVLIHNNLLLTCNHIFSKSQVKQAWVRFNYYKPDSFMLDDYLFELDLNFVSHQNRLDYALLKVKGAPQQLTATPIDAILNSGQEIRLIHHPLGKPVEISGLGEVVQVGEDYIDHNIRTDEGSSGAPIFNRQWELVAIHQGHPGIGRQVDPGTVGGIPIYAIWNQISSHVC